MTDQKDIIKNINDITKKYNKSINFSDFLKTKLKFNIDDDKLITDINIILNNDLFNIPWIYILYVFIKNNIPKYK